ncbi:OmpA family protein [Pseudosulfitobacter koreensis]|uniref:OmpA family protein n=1 Tax=Pseudosulfitobacter koreensis TaxID=2968472 RepID=A0ABT1Z2H8_9RHOB|nr:OmpA family protein [Pseudosulfitobacter koreense]MCR8827340.1 OmpA family protein [Pseudosulfitobacter koreense]
MLFFKHFTYAILLSALFSTGAPAQPATFGDGWTLRGEASSLQFQSIKNGTAIETSSFATMTGEIAPDGAASLTILLDSVDTKIDLRNVRMRFLFFETFQHPEATVTAQIDPALIADLPQVKRKTVTLPFTLALHGVTKTLEAKLALTLVGDDLVAVSTAEPVPLAVADFNLSEGLQKLEEAAGVTIVPSTTVSFDLIFSKVARSDAAVATAEVAAPAARPASVALEAEGDFSLEACVGRFEILSRTGNIYFKPASAQLDAASTPLLDAVAQIVTRCPDLTVQIAGHTDSYGSDAANQTLSERRARSVVDYLTARDIGPARLIAIGYGETRPVADNATEQGRRGNRRIEFSVPD